MSPGSSHLASPKRPNTAHARFEGLAISLVTRASILNQLREQFVADINPERRTPNLDALNLVLLAAYMHADYGNAPTVNPEALQRFVDCVRRSVETLRDRASTVPLLDNDAVAGRVASVYPALGAAPIAEVIAGHFFAVAIIPEHVLAKLEVQDSGGILRGVLGMHLGDTPISVVDGPHRKCWTHELVHNANSTFGALTHNVPAERVLRALESKQLHASPTLEADCVNDVHEELVAALLDMAHGQAATSIQSLVHLLVATSQGGSPHQYLSTAGWRIECAKAALLRDSTSESLAASAHIDSQLERAVRPAAETLLAARLCGEEITGLATMLLYLLKPSQWRYLRTVLEEGLKSPPLATAFKFLDDLQQPLHHLDVPSIRKGVLALGDKAVHLALKFSERTNTFEPTREINSPESLAEAEQKITDLLDLIGESHGCAWRLDRARRQFDTWYPHFFPTRAELWPSEIY